MAYEGSACVLFGIEYPSAPYFPSQFPSETVSVPMKVAVAVFTCDVAELDAAWLMEVEIAVRAMTAKIFLMSLAVNVFMPRG